LVFQTHDITVDIRSVNHRFFEASVKSPRSVSCFEDKIKSIVKEKVTRGKIEISVSLQNISGSDLTVSVNENVLECYVNALRSVGKKMKVKDDLKLSALMRINEAFTLKKVDEDEEKLQEEVLSVVEVALEKFIQMKEKEGESLKNDILSRLCTIENYVSVVEEESPKTLQAYKDRLYAKIQEIVGDRQIDDQRVLTEAAIFADKIAVDEETVRLRSHIKQMREIFEKDGDIGKQLDFLIQEFNREANTIGSKAQDVEITKTVVAIKSEIEKIREQIQNIE
jgi:uncharacterized protein (TIGR00255 family)